MNFDSFFTIGNSHKVCQDYATVSDNFMAISDGCSQSIDCDIGARILAKSAQIHLENLDHIQLISQCNIIANTLKLGQYALDATLNAGVVINNICKLHLYGDGCISIVFKENLLRIFNITYKSGYPHFLSYEIQTERKQSLQNMIGDNLPIISQTDINLLNNEIIETYDAKMLKHGLTLDVDINDVKTIGLYSDGVHSFYDENKNPINYIEIIKILSNISVSKGEFAKRQLNKLHKIMKQNNWNHYDDLSMASLHT